MTPNITKGTNIDQQNGNGISRWWKSLWSNLDDRKTSTNTRYRESSVKSFQSCSFLFSAHGRTDADGTKPSGRDGNHERDKRLDTVRRSLSRSTTTRSSNPQVSCRMFSNKHDTTWRCQTHLMSKGDGMGGSTQTLRLVAVDATHREVVVASGRKDTREGPSKKSGFLSDVTDEKN